MSTVRKVRRILSKERRSLPVILTPSERMTRASSAAALDVEIELLNKEAEGYKSQAKELLSRVDRKEQERKELSRVVRSGQEDREVEVQVEADLKTGTVYEIRLDTGEIIRERDMTCEESQGEMFAESAEEDPEVDVTPTKSLSSSEQKAR